jgi:hypothetical protein
MRLRSTSLHSKFAKHSPINGALTFSPGNAVNPNSANLSMSRPELLPMPTTFAAMSTVGTLITHSLLLRIMSKLWFSLHT